MDFDAKIFSITLIDSKDDRQRLVILTRINGRSKPSWLGYRRKSGAHRIVEFLTELRKKTITREHVDLLFGIGVSSPTLA